MVEKKPVNRDDSSLLIKLTIHLINNKSSSILNLKLLKISIFVASILLILTIKL